MDAGTRVTTDMIHQILSLTRPLFVFDVEATGTDPRTDRIVEIGFQQWTAEGMVKEWRSLVNPGIPIPLEASKVHNIYDLDMTRCQRCHLVRDDRAPDRCRCESPKIVPYFKQIAQSLAKGFVDCDFAGQSVRFDLQLTAAEMERSGVVWSYRGARIIDSYQLERIVVPRSLSHLHEKYVGHKHDGAHGALSDVRAAITVIVHQLQAHQELPRDLDHLHDVQWPEEWLTNGGEFRLVNGVAMCWFGKHRGKPMSEVPLDYYDYILTKDFAADVKALALEAKMCRFPEGRTP